MTSKVIISCLIITNILCNEMKHYSKKSDIKIYGISIVKYAPILFKSGQVYEYKDTFNIFWSGEYAMYEMTYDFDSINNGGSYKKGIRYNYFIFNKKDSLGYFYDYYRSKKSKLCSKDSVIQSKKADIINGPKEPVSLFYNYDSSGITEMYVQKSLYGSKSDTMVYSYTRGLNNVEYSLSPYLDSMRGMKLFRIELSFNIPDSIQTTMKKFRGYIEIRQLGYFEREDKIYDVFYQMKDKYLQKSKSEVK